MGAAPSTLDLNMSEVSADVDDGEADVNLGGDTGPRPMTTSPEVTASSDIDTSPDVATSPDNRGAATSPQVDTSRDNRGAATSPQVDTRPDNRGAATSPDSRNVEAGPVAADVTRSAESPQSRDVGAEETEADKSTAGASDGIDDDDVGAGPDGGRVRLGEETSSSIKYSQEITSPEDEPEREGRSLATTHHEVIKQWAEERGGTPATVDGTEHGDHLGVLRFDFSGDNENLRHVSWEEWFDTFDARRLNFIYQEQRRDGRQSNFFRLESPDREDG
jgi:hypothetical protein